jgi:hypothetical protein
MNWFIGLFIFGFTLFIFWIVRAHRKQDAVKAAKDVPLATLRENRAAELGWHYDATHEGNIRYRFSGTTDQGHRWQLRYDSDASSSVSQPKLIFEIYSVRAERTQFEISAGKSFEMMQSAVGLKVASVAASIAWAVGSGAAQDAFAFCREATIQPLASSRLHGNFKVIARSPRDVSDLLDQETENLLLNWPATVEKSFDPFQQVSIQRGPKGLTIECRYDSTDMPLVEHLVALGCALAARIKPV